MVVTIILQLNGPPEHFPLELVEFPLVSLPSTNSKVTALALAWSHMERMRSIREKSYCFLLRIRIALLSSTALWWEWKLNYPKFCILLRIKMTQTHQRGHELCWANIQPMQSGKTRLWSPCSCFRFVHKWHSSYSHPGGSYNAHQSVLRQALPLPKGLKCVWRRSL